MRSRTPCRSRPGQRRPGDFHPGAGGVLPRYDFETPGGPTFPRRGGRLDPALETLASECRAATPSGFGAGTLRALSSRIFGFKIRFPRHVVNFPDPLPSRFRMTYRRTVFLLLLLPLAASAARPAPVSFNRDIPTDRKTLRLCQQSGSRPSCGANDRIRVYSGTIILSHRIGSFGLATANAPPFNGFVSGES